MWNYTATKLVLVLLITVSTGCMKRCEDCWEPNICYTPPQRFVEHLPSPFKELSPQELKTDWGRELYVGKQFAHEMDLYRSITSFKRALFLIPPSQRERQLEIEYDIFLAYFMGKKYKDAIKAFEDTHLFNVDQTFPAYRELLISLYEAYLQTDEEEKACKVLRLLYDMDQTTANGLSMETAVQSFDFCTLNDVAPYHPAGEKAMEFEAAYCSEILSPSKARTLNTVLPGAGYYYVGQKKAAVTSFLINALFTAAAWQLFDRGYIAGGIIVASLETGWYFGGINGAGIAAEEYNRGIYSCKGKEFLLDNGLFPILMFQQGF